MTPTCPSAVGDASAAIAASTAIVARGASGQSPRAMPHTACATTATATTLRPWRTPAFRNSPYAAMPSPNRISASAEGAVKPIQAATAPRSPPFASPMPMPTWLLAGPGRNWQSATS
jgi:hypothetical protein